MKPNSPQELIEKARQAPRPSKPGVPEIPHGFAKRMAANFSSSDEAPDLRVFERASYAGVAVAACVTLVAALQVDKPAGSDELVADPWLEMPMSSEF